MSLKRTALEQNIFNAKERLANYEVELEQCIIFQSGHGNRVRATASDREAGEQVVAKNRKNTKRIAFLKKEIKRWRKFLR